MKRGSIIFLQAVIVFIGIIALVLLLWEPNIEGVNAHATTLSEVYLDDPFLAYAYATSIAFFVALYQTFKLLGYIGRNEIFSQRSVKALQTIKYCGMIIAVAIGAAVAYLFIVRPGDDIAGGVAVGLGITFISVVVAVAASMFKRVLQSAIDMRSGNDLTT